MKKFLTSLSRVQKRPLKCTRMLDTSSTQRMYYIFSSSVRPKMWTALDFKWEKNLSTVLSGFPDLFSYLCSECWEKRTVSINRIILKTNAQISDFISSQPRQRNPFASWRYLPVRPSSFETNLCNSEISCGTHQKQNDSKDRTQPTSISLHVFPQKAATIQTWCQKWRKNYIWTDEKTLSQWLEWAQKTTSVRCKD